MSCPEDIVIITWNLVQNHRSKQFLWIYYIRTHSATILEVNITNNGICNKLFKNCLFVVLKIKMFLSKFAPRRKWLSAMSYFSNLISFCKSEYEKLPFCKQCKMQSGCQKGDGNDCYNCLNYIHKKPQQQTIIHAKKLFSIIYLNMAINLPQK